MATPLIGLNLPTPGPGGTIGPDWAEQINENFELIDTLLGSRISQDNLEITGDLDMNNYNIKNTLSTRYKNNGSVLSGPLDINSVYVRNGDLYYNNSVGAAIRLTADGALNAAGVGGINGDYATSTADATYSALSKLYAFYSDAGKFARVAIGALSIAQSDTVGANQVTLQSPNSLAAAYTLTLPAALPVADSIVTITTAGVIGASKSFSGLTLSSAAINSSAISGGTITNAILSLGLLNTTRLITSTIENETVDGAGRLQLPQTLNANSLVGTDHVNGTVFMDNFTKTLKVGDGRTFKNVLSSIKGTFYNVWEFAANEEISSTDFLPLSKKVETSGNTANAYGLMTSANTDGVIMEMGIPNSALGGAGGGDITSGTVRFLLYTDTGTLPTHTAEFKLPTVDHGLLTYVQLTKDGVDPSKVKVEVATAYNEGSGVITYTTLGYLTRDGLSANFIEITWANNKVFYKLNETEASSSGYALGTMMPGCTGGVSSPNKMQFKLAANSSWSYVLEAVSAELNYVDHR